MVARKYTRKANNQLIGATYVELFKLGGSTNQTMLADIKRQYDGEVSNISSITYWSWIDATFMAMNTWARFANVTEGDDSAVAAVTATAGRATAAVYSEHMWDAFNDAALQGPTATSYHFWSEKDHLFWRDDRFYNTSTYWGRGNSWAMGALVSAIKHGGGPGSAHYNDYVELFTQQAAALQAIQGADGCWKASSK